MISAGEGKAWEILKSLDPSTVCRNASVVFDEQSHHYILRVFCTDFFVNPFEKTIKSSGPFGEIIMKKFSYFFIHSCLWYLIHAKDISLTGRLIKPVNIAGGGIFFRGSHALPLENLAQRYKIDRETFLKKGSGLCAVELHFGDASVQLLPFPRIPAIIILWLQDEEFPPRADLLLDSSCEMQLPLDIIWSLAMLSILVMM
jgi:hypothetical protein